MLVGLVSSLIPQPASMGLTSIDPQQALLEVVLSSNVSC
jgi:hypothetical protein